MTLGAVVDGDRQRWREAVRLGLPVVDDGQGADDEVWPRSLDEMSQCRRRLAEAHVVGEAAAEARRSRNRSQLRRGAGTAAARRQTRLVRSPRPTWCRAIRRAGGRTKPPRSASRRHRRGHQCHRDRARHLLQQPRRRAGAGPADLPEPSPSAVPSSSSCRRYESWRARTLRSAAGSMRTHRSPAYSSEAPVCSARPARLPRSPTRRRRPQR